MGYGSSGVGRAAVSCQFAAVFLGEFVDEFEVFIGRNGAVFCYDCARLCPNRPQNAGCFEVLAIG